MRSVQILYAQYLVLPVLITYGTYYSNNYTTLFRTIFASALVQTGKSAANSRILLRPEQACTYG